MTSGKTFGRNGCGEIRQALFECDHLFAGGKADCGFGQGFAAEKGGQVGKPQTVSEIAGFAEPPVPQARAAHRNRVKGVNQESRTRRPGGLRVYPAQSLRSGISPAAFIRPYRKALRAQRAGQPGCHRALGGLAPTASGANSVASALGIRSGATPSGYRQPNITSQQTSSKEDISKWQRSGHFYLALTGVPLYCRRHVRMSYWCHLEMSS